MTRWLAFWGGGVYNAREGAKPEDSLGKTSARRSLSKISGWGGTRGARMDPRELAQNLSRISTRWSALRQAHQGSERTAAAARQELMERYCGAVYRYLLRAVRDPHTADDLTQEFAVRFIRGRFRHADAKRGRFRDYVKTSLFHLVDDYRKGAREQPQQLGIGSGFEPAVESPE